MLVDKLRVLRGRDVTFESGITIHQPKISEIEEFGENRFFNVFHTLSAIPSDMKSVLWDMGKDWNKMSDWSLFINLCRGFTKDDTSIVFGDLDFSRLYPIQKQDSEEIIMVEGEETEDGRIFPVENGFVLKEEDYMDFIGYMREMIGYTAKVEKAANRFTRDAMIDEDRRKRGYSMNKEYSSVLFPIIVSLVNTEEFSYTYETAYDLTIYQLMKSYMQIQSKKSACALYQGSMSGFVDTSKMNSKAFTWIYEENKWS